MSRGDPSDQRAVAYALSRVIAHEAILRWDGRRWTDAQERHLADAILLPSSALRAHAHLADDAIAEDLLVDPELVARRRLALRSQLRLVGAPVPAVPSVVKARGSESRLVVATRSRG